jgi:ketosteroid isomerase-like protein
MSQENLELFQDGLAAWNEGDLQRILDMCHPDVVWTFSNRLPDAIGDITGKAAVERFFDRFIEDWAEVAEVEFTARGREGIEVSMRLVHVWTARDGQVVRFRGYATLDEALAAVRTPD